MLEKKLKDRPNEWFMKDSLKLEFNTNDSTIRNAFNQLSYWDRNFKKIYKPYTRIVRSITGYDRKVTTERVYYGYFPDSCAQQSCANSCDSNRTRKE